tara:strand:+ start:144 stop:710 length:567 start_codon:yes stop_codon:yes gene_type:complete
MSRLVTNAIRSTAASSDAITIDSAGKPSFPNGGVGKILQVVQTFKKDAFSTSNSYATEITGFNASITKTSASNKILISVDVGFSRAGRDVTRFYLYEDSSELTAYRGTGGSSDGTFMLHYNHLQSTTEETYSFYRVSNTVLIDGQNDTNSHTYKLYATSSATSFYLNRRSYSHDYVQTSSITLMEVAA